MVHRSFKRRFWTKTNNWPFDLVAFQQHSCFPEPISSTSYQTCTTKMDSDTSLSCLRWCVCSFSQGHVTSLLPHNQESNNLPGSSKLITQVKSGWISTKKKIILFHFSWLFFITITSCFSVSLDTPFKMENKIKHHGGKNVRWSQKIYLPKRSASVRHNSRCGTEVDLF